MTTLRTSEPDREGPGGTERVPLSRCDLWRRQRDFYRREGAAAWPGKVPGYVTNNPYIANACAHVVFGYMRDHARGAQARPLEPFYILELGAGSGSFAFHFLQSMARLQQPGSGPQIPFVYVMTDSYPEILDFWRRHPALSGFLEQGLLDFAVFDLESEDEVRLVHSGLRLEPGCLEAGNPLIVLANYVFDSLSHDVFHVADGRLEEILVEPSPAVPEVEYNTSVPLSALSPGLVFREAGLPHYGAASLDAVLASYRRAPGGFLTFPIGGLRCILRLAECAGGRLFLLATDKAYAHHLDLFAPMEPDLAVHHSLSITVNFDAFGRLFRQLGGDCFHQTVQQSISTSAFTLGSTLDALPELRREIATHLETCSPGNLFALYRHLEKTHSGCSLDVLIGYLGLTLWDPRAFHLLFETILARIKSASLLEARDLAMGLRQVAESVYHLPGSPDTWSHLGIALVELGDHRGALDLFERSLHDFGRTEASLFNLGLCLFQLGDLVGAAERFREVVALRPDHIMALGWLAHLETLQAGTARPPALAAEIQR